MAHSRAPLALMLVSGVVAVSAGLAAYAEGAPYLYSGLTPEAKFEALAAGATPLGLSIDAKKLALDDCLRAIRSIYGRAQTTPRRQRVLDNCQALSAAVTAAAPSYSYGWYVAAAVAAEKVDTNAFNAALARAQLTGANEQWVAEMRVELAEDHYAALSDTTRRQHDADLALLIRSPRGVALIARRYVTQPDFRDRVTAIAETLPAEAQRQFLRYVRRAADAAAPGPA